MQCTTKFRLLLIPTVITVLYTSMSCPGTILWFKLSHIIIYYIIFMIVLHVLCVCKCSPAGQIMGAGTKLKQVLSIHLKTMET